MKCQPGNAEATDGASLLASPHPTQFSVLVFGATPLFDFNSNKPVLALYAKMKKPHFPIFFIFLLQYFFLFVCPSVCVCDSDVALIVNALGELDVICLCRTRDRPLPTPLFFSFSPTLELQGRQGEAVRTPFSALQRTASFSKGLE